jgi:hypothetical protein
MNFTQTGCKISNAWKLILYPYKSITVNALTSTELMPVLTKFNENVTNGLVADTGSQVDRQRDAVF